MFYGVIKRHIAENLPERVEFCIEDIDGLVQNCSISIANAGGLTALYHYLKKFQTHFAE